MYIKARRLTGAIAGSIAFVLPLFAGTASAEPGLKAPATNQTASALLSRLCGDGVNNPLPCGDVPNCGPSNDGQLISHPTLGVLACVYDGIDDIWFWLIMPASPSEAA